MAASANYQVMLSGNLTKVLQTNSTADSFAPSSLVPGVLQPSATEPMGVDALGYNVYPAGQGGAICSLGLYLVPFAEADENSVFFIRVTGWRQAGNDPNSLVWLPMYLVTLTCQTGDLRGPPMPNGSILQPRQLKETERCCDLIGIVDGGIGDEGELSSWGSGRLAWVFVELMGCQKWQVEFAGSGNIGMNSFYATG